MLLRDVGSPTSEETVKQQRLTITLLALGLCACASQPQPGSMEAIMARAEHMAIEECLTTVMMHEHPNVPMLAVWDGCHEAVVGRPRVTQRITGEAY